MRRTIGTSILMTLAMSFVLAAMAHSAVTTNTIVVTPSNMAAMGWTYKATTLSHLPSEVAAECGFSVAPKGAVDVPVYGQGGFWADTRNYLNGEGSWVNQVFLGTNNYKDIKLSDITKLEYRAFTADFSSDMSGRYARTPWQLQLAISKHGDGTFPSRYLMYRKRTTRPTYLCNRNSAMLCEYVQVNATGGF